MKKVLSFVLVLAMILGSVSMVFADVAHSAVTFNKNNAQPFEDAPNSKLATVLRDLNVLVGNDGKVFLDQTISRAEVCAILMRVLGYEDYCTAPYAIAAASSFSDVASGYWANGYINLAAQLGYVDGIGGGKFNPTGEVTLAEGVAFIMKALGYSADHLTLDWPYNFLVPAESMGLLKGVEKTDGAITRDAMFTILYNAMDEPIVTWQANLTNVVLNNNDKVGTWQPTGSTFAKKASGHVAGEYYVATDAAVICPEVISAAAAAKALDLSAYEGQYVEYVKASDGSILFVSKVLSTELKGEVELKDDVMTIAGVAVVEDPGYINCGGYILYNGSEEDGLCLQLAESGDEVIANVLLDKDGKIATVASVEFWNATETFQVSEDEAEFAAAGVVSYAAFLNALDSTKFAPVYTDASKSAIACEFIGVDGLEDIAEDDIITVYADANKAVNRIVVVRDVVEDVKLTKVVSTKYTFDNGKTYELADDAKALDGIKPNGTYNFTTAMSLFLNGDGKIVESRLPKAEAAKVEYTTGYAVFVEKKVGYTYSWDSTKFERVATTNNAITIVPFGAPEAVKFENVSVAGLAGANGWDATLTFAEGNYVEYKVSLDGDLLWVSSASITESDVEGGLFKNGAVGGKYLAKDVVIVNKLGVAYATGRGILEASALEGKKVTGKAITVKNAVATLIVTEVEADVIPSTETSVSPVAIIDAKAQDANGKIVAYFDGAEKSAYASGTAVDGFDCDGPELFTITFNKATGKVTTIVALGVDKANAETVATATAVTDTVWSVTDGSNNFYLASPVVWTYSATKGWAAAECADPAAFNALIKANCKSGINYYVVGTNAGANTYNLVVIY